jgi:hypothetical protein
MVGGSLRVLRLLPPLKLVAMILLKVASKNQKIKLQSRAQTHAVLVIGLYELLGNPTT